LIRNFLQRLMVGRYGGDQLSKTLLVAYLVLYLAGLLSHAQWLYYASILLLAWGLFRMLSRNYERRSAENAAFLRAVQPGVRWFRLRQCAHRDKEHCYFTCPTCKQQLRAPRGKGKIHVTCRSCGTVFEKKT
jgi:hypothetical protein